MDNLIQRLLLPVSFFLFIILAFYAGNAISEEKYVELFFALCGIGIFFWAVFGYNYWWIPMFFFLGLGGFFYFGFKIYMHEIALLICLAPLAFVFIFQEVKQKRERYHVPILVWLLFGYLILHFIGMYIYYKFENLQGWGNIMRRYMDALWPFFIVIPYIYYGKSKYISWAIFLFFIATIIRFTLNFGFYLTEREEFIYIPGINYVPPDAGGFTDLRYSGTFLASLAFCYFKMSKNPLVKLIFFPLIILGFVGTALGGGRIAMLALTGLFGFACIIYRTYWMIISWFFALLIFTFLVNINTEFLYKLPDQARRAASAFILDRDLAADIGKTRSSDEFHAILQNAGFKTWTENLFNFFFGRGTRRFEESARYEDPMIGMVDMAIQTSRFEKGLWDVLVTFGLIGFILYSLVMIQIIRTCYPVLVRDKIKTPLHAMMFIAVYWSIFWFLICWIGGSFPSNNIFFGVIAQVAAYDLKLIVPKKETQSVGFLSIHVSSQKQSFTN